jgi:xanthine dehydrogenase accessory factor
MPSADEIIVAWPEETLAQVQPDASTAIVVLTHDDKFDMPMMEGALATDAYYLGWLGSRKNQERRRNVLLEKGVTRTDLMRISGPSGLDIGADTPAETAFSILSEILAVRAGRAGGRLKNESAPIHVGAVRA